MNTVHFCIFLSVNFLSSPWFPPSPQHFLYQPLLSSLHLPPPCALPSLPSPLVGPPARSFPRTACSQHPLPDWLMGIKGPVLPPSTWLNSSSTTTVIVRITPEAAHCTCNTHVPYTHSPAHMYMRQRTQRHAQLTEDTGKISFIASCLLSLKLDWSWLLYALHDISFIRMTKDAFLQIQKYSSHWKYTWPTLTVIVVWSEHASSFKISEHDIQQAQQTWKHKAASFKGTKIDSQQNGHQQI